MPSKHRPSSGAVALAELPAVEPASKPTFPLSSASLLHPVSLVPPRRLTCLLCRFFLCPLLCLVCMPLGICQLSRNQVTGPKCCPPQSSCVFPPPRPDPPPSPCSVCRTFTLSHSPSNTFLGVLPFFVFFLATPRRFCFNFSSLLLPNPSPPPRRRFDGPFRQPLSRFCVVMCLLVSPGCRGGPGGG